MDVRLTYLYHYTAAALSIAGTVTNASCYGCTNGCINTTVSSGTPAYGYVWIMAAERRTPRAFVQVHTL